MCDLSARSLSRTSSSTEVRAATVSGYRLLGALEDLILHICNIVYLYIFPSFDIK
ncbi:hypothetical protein RchiOBHm_Chr2g0147721 [Rosa chinensis]|uniref:Uncharacterized protein n=1 Tax=Rosa chinensis TaxID=74649 RepID=A0A2P6RZ73_ROSCH|nr:hypothetical protein RchiOBHm_Chr2g0147721 [Rosa chinensis]